MILKYITYLYINPNSGVNKKIHQQVACLNNNGLKTDLVWVNQRENITTNNYDCTRTFKNKTFFYNIIHKISLRFIYEIHIIKTIRNLQPSDVVYMRYSGTIMYSPIIYYRRIRKCKMVLEFNGVFDYGSKKNGLKNNIYSFWESIFYNIVLNQIDGVVGVTDEITNHHVSKIRADAIPHITIGNGIEVNSIHQRVPPSFNDRTLEIIAVATIMKWHAFDRLLRGMTDYSGNVRIKLHIVGDGSEKQYLMDLVKELNLESSVIFHGFLSGEKLDILFNKCHIAIGSLGLHRLGLSEASSLKTREYCARGIPFMLSNFDPDFPISTSFIIRVPPDESNIDMNRLIEFARNQYSNPNHHILMREYAENNLDWNDKMMKLKKFVESLN